MPYCLSINTNEGLVVCTYSYASANDDNNAISKCMHRFAWPGNRFIVILSAGNLTTIDAVLDKIHQDLDQQSSTNLLSYNSLNEIADYLADISVQQQKYLNRRFEKAQDYSANFIVAGQIINKKIETLLVYAEGNYIHEPYTSPFLQIGEIKYGKPILDRIIKPNLSLNTAAHCALVSVDSTMRSNPPAKMKTELVLYKNNSLAMSAHLKLDENSRFFKKTAKVWGEGIISAIEKLPHFYWE